MAARICPRCHKAPLGPRQRICDACVQAARRARKVRRSREMAAERKAQAARALQSPDTLKKWLPCLGCGKRLWTDRCHRFCKRCKSRERHGRAGDYAHPVTASMHAEAFGPSHDDWRQC